MKLTHSRSTAPAAALAGLAAALLLGGLSMPAAAQEADFDPSDDATYTEATQEALREYQAERRQAQQEYGAGEIDREEYREELAQAASDYTESLEDARDEFLEWDWDQDDYAFYDPEYSYTADPGEEDSWFDGIDWW